MYVHRAFQAETEKALAFLAERAFGALVVHDGQMAHASHLPFLFERAEGDTLGRVRCHVAKSNPLHHVIGEGQPALLIVSGPDAYISPNWYVSPEQVPTWNYIAVHATGRARTLPAAELRPHVEALSARFETRVNPARPWTLDKVNEQRIEAMLQGVVGIEFAIEQVQGQWKLNQHKKSEDHVAAVAGLLQLGDPSSKAIARAMDEARAG